MIPIVPLKPETPSTWLGPLGVYIDCENVDQ